LLFDVGELGGVIQLSVDAAEGDGGGFALGGGVGEGKRGLGRRRGRGLRGESGGWGGGGWTCGDRGGGEGSRDRANREACREYEDTASWMGGVRLAGHASLQDIRNGSDGSGWKFEGRSGANF
jgi:hypothetical protein